MEIVSNKLSVSATTTPQGSLRSLERKETSTQARKWNVNTPQQRSSHRRRESLTGGSLMSLKAYYRKLRTFKGTIKALISLRRLPMFASRTASATLAAASTTRLSIAEHTGEESGTKVSTTEPPKVAEAVAKLTDDQNALQAVQSQVKELVEKGHVVTELSGAGKQDVTYRRQGNLDHYTEENLCKRVRLQEHPHMVALTQRLWLSAVHEQEDHLSFGEYEAYMLRLHRLILPEFDLAQSRDLIKDDWARDTNGSDALDYRYFHFSMFELVDLWTDTVEAEDYISLLYCIMHSLTFEWNGRHVLKALEDINPIDIMEASKEMTMDEIERDLAREVNSDDAQLYRDRIASDGDDDGANGAIAEDGEDAAQAEADTTEPVVALAPDQVDSNAGTSRPEKKTTKPAAAARKPSRGPNATASGTRAHQQQEKQPSPSADATSPRATTAAKSPQPRRKSPREDTKSASRRPPPIQTSSVAADDHAAVALRLRADLQAAAALPLPDDTLPSEVDATAHTNDAPSDAVRGGRARSPSQFGPHGAAAGSRGGAGASVAYTGPRLVLSTNDQSQHAGGGGAGDPLPVGIMSLGSGGEFVNMVGKPTYIRKQSALASGLSPRQQGGSYAGDQSVCGQGLGGGTGGTTSYGASGAFQANDHDPAAFPALPSHMGGSGVHGAPTSGRATFVSPRSPQSPRLIPQKESETRPGYLLVNGETQQRHGSTTHGNLSPRARSAKSQARFSTPLVAVGDASALPLYVGGSGDRASVSGSPLSSLASGVAPLQSGALDASALMIGGGLQSSRMSILARPATSTTTSPRGFSIAPASAGGLDGFLQTKAYPQELPSSPTRPSTRGSRMYSPPHGSQVHTTDTGGDFAVVSFGVQATSSSPRQRPLSRSTIAHYNYTSPQQQPVAGAFFGSVVGARSLETGTSVRKSPVARASVGCLPVASMQRRVLPGTRASAADLGLAGAPARLSVHKADAAARPAAKP